jgi:hypothetical protein
MLVTLFGMEMLVSKEQPANAELPMLIKPFERDMLVRAVQR